jgi:Tfp pilus assembly protein FimV
VAEHDAAGSVLTHEHLYDRRAMARRSRARYLAPIALAATIAGTYVIVHDGLTHKKQPPPHAATTRKPRRKFPGTFYSVQPGDSLTSIAAKTGIAVAALEALNPNIDPNALQTSQRIRLRR